MRTVLLDNEAVQALIDPTHRKHRSALAMIEATAARNLRRAGTHRVVVPTTVRVEAGWDRRRPAAAGINRLRVADDALDGDAANRAAMIRGLLEVSVVDAHLGAVLAVTPTPVTVVTSDPDDIRRIVAHLDVQVTVARL